MSPSQAFEQLPAWVGQLDDAFTEAITALENARYLIRGVGGIPSGQITQALQIVERVRQVHREVYEIRDAP